MPTRDTDDNEIREPAVAYDPHPGVPAAEVAMIGLPAGEEPRYGSRWVEEQAADGGVRWREVALSWEDLFDPQEGDVMVHGTLHGQIIRKLAEMLQHWFTSRGRCGRTCFSP